MMSQVMTWEQPLLHGLSWLEEQKGDHSHEKQVVLPPQSPALVWAQKSVQKELPSPFALRLAPGQDPLSTTKDALRIPVATRFEQVTVF